MCIHTIIYFLQNNAQKFADDGFEGLRVQALVPTTTPTPPPRVPTGTLSALALVGIIIAALVGAILLLPLTAVIIDWR